MTGRLKAGEYSLLKLALLKRKKNSNLAGRQELGYSCYINRNTFRYSLLIHETLTPSYCRVRGQMETGGLKRRKLLKEDRARRMDAVHLSYHSIS